LVAICPGVVISFEWTLRLPSHAAAIQRCQVHKRWNVLDHLTDEQKPAVAKKLNAAYAKEDYAAAKQALDSLHRELMDLNPSAARSLGEGMEETLTVHRLQVTDRAVNRLNPKNTWYPSRKLRTGVAVGERSPATRVQRGKTNLTTSVATVHYAVGRRVLARTQRFESHSAPANRSCR
jgi:hypothetical protein